MPNYWTHMLLIIGLGPAIWLLYSGIYGLVTNGGVVTLDWNAWWGEGWYEVGGLATFIGVSFWEIIRYFRRP